MNYLVAIATMLSLPLMGMHSNSSENNNNKIFQLCKNFSKTYRPEIDLQNKIQKPQARQYHNNIDNEPSLKALQDRRSKKHRQIKQLMLHSPIHETKSWAQQNQHSTKDFLRQEEANSPLGALCIIQATDSPATDNIQNKIWKNLGYTLSEQDKKEFNNLTGFGLLYRVASKKHIQDIMLQKINPVDVTLLNPKHLKTLNELAEIYKTENKRLVPINKELLAKIKQLPPEILDCCVQSFPNKSDKLLYIYVPSTTQDNFKNLAFATAGGGIFGGLVAFTGNLVAQGAVNIGNQARKAGQREAKQKVAELIKPTIKEYAAKTMYKPDELNAIASDNLHDIVYDDRIAIEEASVPFALETAKEYYSEVIKKNISDKEANKEFFKEKLIIPVIVATANGVKDSVIQTIGNPKSYSDNLDTKALAKKTALGFGIGATLSALWQLRKWDEPIVPPTAIKHINQADTPEKDTVL
ncbi:MAG TPA: hypothetical protein VGW78_07080 [Candidatus Babeliales bacterium]|jgi:hypothetical protein|nr:hypothetical protein [Candidatus Babeliales bacterium]